MKKLLFGVMALGMLAACNTTEETANLTEDNARTATASRKSCPSEEIRAELLKNDAKARARFAAIEAGTEKQCQSDGGGDHSNIAVAGNFIEEYAGQY